MVIKDALCIPDLAFGTDHSNLNVEKERSRFNMEEKRASVAKSEGE